MQSAFKAVGSKDQWCNVIEEILQVPMKWVCTITDQFYTEAISFSCDLSSWMANEQQYF